MLRDPLPLSVSSSIALLVEKCIIIYMILRVALVDNLLRDREITHKYN